MENRSILLLEDNLGDAKLIQMILSTLVDPAYEVTAVQRLREVKEILLQQAFDVALVDLTVPDSTGLETVSAMIELAPRMPFIVLTGMLDKSLGQDAVQLGAQDFLMKGEFDELLLERTITFAISRQGMKNELRESENRVRTIIESNADGIIVINQKKKIQFVNPAAEKLFGQTKEELLDTIFTYSNHSRDEIEIVPKNNGNNVRSVELHCVDIDWQAQPAQLISLRDISQRVELESQLRHMATHDPLTGIPNRTIFEDRLALALKRYERYEHYDQTSDHTPCHLAVILLDLDEFKLVNDTYGHPQGDRMLVEIANRLSHTVRESDTVARLGGDEFVIIVENITALKDLKELIQRVMKTLHQPIVLDGGIVEMTSSIGVSCYPDDGKDYTTLFKHADIALYQAKETRNQCRFFSHNEIDLSLDLS